MKKLSESLANTRAEGYFLAHPTRDGKDREILAAWYREVVKLEFDLVAAQSQLEVLRPLVLAKGAMP